MFKSVLHSLLDKRHQVYLGLLIDGMERSTYQTRKSTNAKQLDNVIVPTTGTEGKHTLAPQLMS